MRVFHMTTRAGELTKGFDPVQSKIMFAIIRSSPLGYVLDVTQCSNILSYKLVLGSSSQIKKIPRKG